MVQIIFTLLGIVAVLCVPALWVSWSEAVYYGVLATFFSTVGLIMLLTWLFPDRLLTRAPVDLSDDAPDPDAPSSSAPGAPSRHWFNRPDGNRDEGA